MILDVLDADLAVNKTNGEKEDNDGLPFFVVMYIGFCGFDTGANGYGI